MIQIGLKDKARVTIAEKLNILLSNEFALYVKTLNYHWNVQGKHFGALHEFFKQQYEQLFDIIDAVAERAVTLGIPAFGTLKQFINNNTEITEHVGKKLTDLEMLADLMQDHEKVTCIIRGLIELTVELNDAGTNNFLADTIEQHEKMVWMLRAHITENK